MKRYSAKTARIYRKVARHAHLPAFLEASGITRDLPVRLGWGMRPSGRAAMAAAPAQGERLLILEDAFVRSIRPGPQGAVYGVIADSQGIHYRHDGASDLLDALNSGQPCGWMRDVPFAGDEPAALMDRMRRVGVSKYNWFPGEYREGAGQEYEEGILVVDQTRGDASLRHGAGGMPDFERMLRAALEENPGVPVYVRGHPDHRMRGKLSCFPEKLLRDPRIRHLPPDLSPSQCFRFCRTVMVVGSLLGMEALIHGCRVVTFGWPFFAGWGLTDDRSTAPRPPRRRTLDLEELFDFSYLRYGHYFDPDHGAPCGLATIVDHIALQKDMFRRNRGVLVTAGFSPWNRKIAEAYFRSPGGTLVHARSLAGAVARARAAGEGKVLMWGRKQEIPDGMHDYCLRVEDGFLRSKGLGATFAYPCSWVVDGTGIYFDATGPSDLELRLQGGFTEHECAEARQLIETLRHKRLTKYNLNEPQVRLDPALVKGRKVILVPGQVERDASIAFGSPEVKSNLKLLKRVRQAEPDACIVFKAHPDLVAGARHGSLLPPDLVAACDIAVTKGNVLDWLEQCDEVHTATSTVGFEALIRGVPVVTYGMPFYAGWGLTTDRLHCARRTRKISIEELVCAALLQYPRYLNPRTGEFTTAQKVADILTAPDSPATRRALHLRLVTVLKKYWVKLAR